MNVVTRNFQSTQVNFHVLYLQMATEEVEDLDYYVKCTKFHYTCRTCSSLSRNEDRLTRHMQWMQISAYESTVKSTRKGMRLPTDVIDDWGTVTWPLWSRILWVWPNSTNDTHYVVCLFEALQWGGGKRWRLNWKFWSNLKYQMIAPCNWNVDFLCQGLYAPHFLSSRSLKNHQIGTYIRQARERQTNRLAMFNAIAFEYTEPDPT